MTACPARTFKAAPSSREPRSAGSALRHCDIERTVSPSVSLLEPPHRLAAGDRAGALAFAQEDIGAGGEDQPGAGDDP